MSQSSSPYLIAYGPNSNCTLQEGPTYCPVSDSVYGYRPSLGANISFLALFFITMIIHIIQGLRWRTWFFVTAMLLGCICEIIGYGARILLYQNPFSFPGFLMQIICITIGPAFYSGAIYFTLSKIVVYLGENYSRLRPNAYYWIFIPCDIFSLILQSAGGALSSSSSGSSQAGVDVAIAGLSFQVFTLCVFIASALDFSLRYRRGRRSSPNKVNASNQFKVFAVFLSLAIALILVRCVYRIDELSDGYNGPLIHNERLFIGLEGVMIIVAAFCLNIGHPGPVFGHMTDRKGIDASGEDATQSTEAEKGPVATRI